MAPRVIDPCFDLTLPAEPLNRNPRNSVHYKVSMDPPPVAGYSYNRLVRCAMNADDRDTNQQVRGWREG